MVEMTSMLLLNSCRCVLQVWSTNKFAQNIIVICRLPWLLLITCSSGCLPRWLLHSFLFEYFHHFLGVVREVSETPLSIGNTVKSVLLFNYLLATLSLLVRLSKKVLASSKWFCYSKPHLFGYVCGNWSQVVARMPIILSYGFLLCAIANLKPLANASTKT